MGFAVIPDWAIFWSFRKAKKMVAKILAEDNPDYFRGPTDSPEAWTGNHLQALQMVDEGKGLIIFKIQSKIVLISAAREGEDLGRR
jgi:hypothetical protein